LHQLFEAADQRLDIGVQAVRRQACAGSAIDSERADQRLGTMMPAAQRDAVSIEMAANILGGTALHGEGHHTPPIVRVDRPQHAHPCDRGQSVEQAARQSQLMVVNGAPIERLHPVERRTEADGAGVTIDANGPIPGLPGKYLDARQPKYFKGPDRPRLGESRLQRDGHVRLLSAGGSRSDARAEAPAH
jgi:hypothetical protein